MQAILEKLLDEQCFIIERSTLECLYGGEHFYAINEMVIKGINRLLSVDCFVNESMYAISGGWRHCRHAYREHCLFTISRVFYRHAGDTLLDSGGFE